MYPGTTIAKRPETSNNTDTYTRITIDQQKHVDFQKLKKITKSLHPTVRVCSFVNSY